MKKSSIIAVFVILFSLLLVSCEKKVPTPATEAQKMIEMKQEAEQKLNDSIKMIEEKEKKALEDL